MSGATARKRRQQNKTVPTEVSDGPSQATFSEQEGVLIAREPSLFRHGCELLCCRLAYAAARQPDVRVVHICSGSGTCRIEFAPGEVTASQMAERFARAIHQAIAGEPRDPACGSERGWAALTVFAHGETVSPWETIRAGEGQLRLRNRVLNKDSKLARELARALAHAPGVQACRVTRISRHLLIRFDPAATSPERVLADAEEAFRRLLRPALDRSTIEEPGESGVASGVRRGGFLALAGGSFVLTLAGLVIPGVPTVPFLLATSYYLGRSSPALNRRLLRSRFFGPILSDLQTWGGLRRVNKLRLIVLTVFVSAVTVIIAGPPLVLVMFSAASATIYTVSRLPRLPSQTRQIAAKTTV